MTQRSLFDELPEEPTRSRKAPPLDRFQGALLLSTVGDAMGWPTEFLKPLNGTQAPFEVPVRSFLKWKKLVGGKWWGYEEQIAPGTYSDDTQLALAVARCITDMGVFEPERFAYEELPLWLQYERGGGKSVKTAARKLIGKNASWLRNFYKQGELDYKDAGANGAAMRNLPVALANVDNEKRIIRDSFFNAIITHGHPRAILGTILFGLAVNYALTSTNGITPESYIAYLRNEVSQVGKVAIQDSRISEWIQRWDQNAQAKDISFKTLFNKVHQEASTYLNGIHQYLPQDPRHYYTFVGALNPATKGSGLATVCVAIYLFMKYINSPMEALITAVNTFGSDTDTIGVFVGALLGAYHGINILPVQLATQVQDRDYLLKTATRLHAIAVGEQQDRIALPQETRREDAYFKILAWEIGLHEMFWDAIEEGGIVFHPTLGRGKIEQKITKPIKNRDDYVVKLISIQFDSGQSCLFHSRVQNNEKISESLAPDVVKALDSSQ